MGVLVHNGKQYAKVFIGNTDLPTLGDAPSGVISSFNTDLAYALNKLKISFSAYQASGTPTPSTPIPISGFSSAKLFRTNVNIWGGLQMANDVVNTINNASYSTTGEDANGKYFTLKAGSAISGKAFFERFKANTQYTLIMKVSKETNPSNKTCNLVISYTDGTSTAFSVPTDFSDQNVQTVAITSTSGKTVKEIKGGWYSGTNRFYYENCGLFEGAISTIDFVAYSGTSVVIPFGDTYYGCEIDVVHGKLKVLCKAVDLKLIIFEQHPNYTDIFRANITQFDGIVRPAVEVDQETLCERYTPSVGTSALADMPNGTIAIGRNGVNYVFCRNSACSTLSDFTNSLGTSCYFVYPLVEPIEIDIDSAIITALTGEVNNVYCDIPTSEVEELQFFETVYHHINQGG